MARVMGLRVSGVSGVSGGQSGSVLGCSAQIVGEGSVGGSGEAGDTREGGSG